MRDNRRQRMTISSSYIGSGNLTSVFARRPKIPFVRLKQIYGDEMERFRIEKNSEQYQKSELTEKQKKIIRKRVESIIKRNKNRELTNGIIAILITLGLIYLFLIIIEN